MSQLTIYSEKDCQTIHLSTQAPAKIKTELNKIGVQFKRWHLAKELPEDAGAEAIIQAYQSEIDSLLESGGYQSFDVVSMNPDNPDKAEFRQKFLDEHIHYEDEVRFFVRGQGLFVLHIEDKVFSILCEKDDLISVPAKTKHWFDMGPNPEFTVIRVFDNLEGWVAEFTGDQIADNFPGLEN